MQTANAIRMFESAHIAPLPTTAQKVLQIINEPRPSPPDWARLISQDLTMVENFTSGIIGVSSDGMIAFISKAIQALFKQPCMLGLPPDRVLPEDLSPLIRLTKDAGRNRHLTSFTYDGRCFHIESIFLSQSESEAASDRRDGILQVMPPAVGGWG